MIKPSPFGQAIGQNLNPKTMPLVGTVVSGTERMVGEGIGGGVISVAGQVATGLGL